MSLKRLIDRLIGVPLSAVLSSGVEKIPAPSDPRKILIIKLAAMGDTVLLIPVLHAFRMAHPDAEIHWLVSPINQAVAKTVPYVDENIVWQGGIGAVPALLKRLRSERYDLVCDLEQWARGTALVAYFSGASHRLGFDLPGQSRGNLFTQTIEKKYDRHEIEDFYSLLSLPKPLDRSGALELPITDAGRVELMEKASFLQQTKEPKLTVLIHPGCGADGLPREWPLERYVVVAHWLIKQHNARIVLTSGPEETGKTRNLRKLLGGQAVDLGGQLSWHALAALIDRCDLVLSGNTGVMHMAAALNKPQVALHGPTNPKIWGPINSNAVVVQSDCPQCPCLKLGFEYHASDQSCMARIDEQSVKSAILRLIDNKRPI